MNAQLQEWVALAIIAAVVGAIVFAGARVVLRVVARVLAQWHLKRGRVGKAMYWRKFSGYPRGAQSA